MSKKNNSKAPQTNVQKVQSWIEHRFPIFSFAKHVGDNPTPRNITYLWNFGSLLGITLVIMIISGIFLAMHYTPHVDHAFNSVEHIMREVNYGWLIRYIHMNGASMFFLLVYLHIFRGLYYGSYKSPREILWIMGVIIYCVMMATAFMGYVLPWGQMSFWGVTVITNFFTAIPLVGNMILEWLLGNSYVENPALNRFFVLHYLLPFILVGMSGLHLIALHMHHSNNPLGVEIKTKKDSIPFHPYHTIKDLFGLGVFLLFFSWFIFFSPNFFGEPDNYIPANPLVTPPHIVPEWYFLPFYAILRSIPDKTLGVVMMAAAIIVLFFIPWLDRSPVKSARFRPIYKKLYWLHVVVCLILGYLGKQEPTNTVILVGQICSFYYFAHFLIVMPLLPRFEKTKPEPESISAYLENKYGQKIGK